jgi:hypothetical protein
MNDYQTRVIKEKEELDTKIAALDCFIQLNPIFKQLSSIEQTLLLMQKSVMLSYTEILDSRIEFWRRQK